MSGNVKNVIVGHLTADVQHPLNKTPLGTGRSLHPEVHGRPVHPVDVQGGRYTPLMYREGYTALKTVLGGLYRLKDCPGRLGYTHLGTLGG